MTTAAVAHDVLGQALESMQQPAATSADASQEAAAAQEQQSSALAQPTEGAEQPTDKPAETPAPTKKTEREVKLTREQVKHALALESRESKIEAKSKKLTEREAAIVEREQKHAADRTAFESMVTDFVDGDANKKISVMSRVKGADLKAIYERMSESLAGVQTSQPQADLEKLVREAIASELAPIKSEREKAEESAKAQQAAQARAEQDTHVATRLGTLAAHDDYPTLKEFTALVGADSALKELWGLGRTMVRLGQTNPKEFPEYAGMNHLTAAVMIAERADKWLRNSPQGKARLAQARIARGQQTQGAGDLPPATSLSAGQAQGSSSRVPRPLTGDGDPNVHRRLSRDQQAQLISEMLPIDPTQLH